MLKLTSNWSNSRSDVDGTQVIIRVVDRPHCGLPDNTLDIPHWLRWTSGYVHSSWPRIII